MEINMIRLVLGVFLSSTTNSQKVDVPFRLSAGWPLYQWGPHNARMRCRMQHVHRLLSTPETVATPATRPCKRIRKVNHRTSSAGAGCFRRGGAIPAFQTGIGNDRYLHNTWEVEKGVQFNINTVELDNSNLEGAAKKSNHPKIRIRKVPT
jgi:hypothetical protein